MLIKYRPKQEHIKCVPLIPVGEELKKISLARSQVQLLPGINEVTDDEWSIMKVHLAREIKDKSVTVIEEAAAENRKTADGKAHNLKDMLIDKAIPLIGECVNPDTLNKWHQEETREEVRLAIAERMKELKVEIPKFRPGRTKQENTGGTEPEADKKSELVKKTEEKK